jgi:hypothetical protein
MILMSTLVEPLAMSDTNLGLTISTDKQEIVNILRN